MKQILEYINSRTWEELKKKAEKISEWMIASNQSKD